MAEAQNQFLHPLKKTPLPLFPFWAWVFLVVISLIKITLISGLTLSANGYTRYDDTLFLNLATSLASGEWLGPYTHLTLAKGPFFPIWIAILFKLGVPLLLANHLLYIAGCGFFILALRPVLPKPRSLLLIFSILLFNPVSYTDEVMTRVIREGIYPALTLLVLACAIGIMVRPNHSLPKLSPWLMGLGLAISAFWLTREEGIWIIPSLLIIFGFSLFKIWKEAYPHRMRRIALLFLPFGIWLISLAAISGINYSYYGIFNTVEFKSKEFLSAYGALSRVRHSNWHPKIPIPRETREQVYETSPTFAQLKPLLEGGFGKGWATISCQSISVCDDIGGGWFMWALRDAVAITNHHASGKTAADYYLRLATEINIACANKKMDCESERATMMPVWNSTYNGPLIKTFFRALAFLITWDDAKPLSSPSIGSEKSLKYFSFLTHENLSPKTDQIGKTKKRDFGLKFLNTITLGYHWATPLLFGLGLLVFSRRIFQLIRTRDFSFLWVIQGTILLAVIVRILILSIIDVTSFPSINTLYLAPSYPLLLIFVALTLIDFKFKKPI